jgi:hypothetical protein
MFGDFFACSLGVATEARYIFLIWPNSFCISSRAENQQQIISCFAINMVPWVYNLFSKQQTKIYMNGGLWSSTPSFSPDWYFVQKFELFFCIKLIFFFMFLDKKYYFKSETNPEISKFQL